MVSIRTKKKKHTKHSNVRETEMTRELPGLEARLLHGEQLRDSAISLRSTYTSTKKGGLDQPSPHAAKVIVTPGKETRGDTEISSLKFI